MVLILSLLPQNIFSYNLKIEKPWNFVSSFKELYITSINWSLILHKIICMTLFGIGLVRKYSIFLKIVKIEDSDSYENPDCDTHQQTERIFIFDEQNNFL